MLGIGTSALAAFQNALRTTSHNISNSATPGYSRQRVNLGTNPPQFLGNGYVGSGVKTLSVERVVDQFLTTQLRDTTSNFHGVDAFHNLASQVDNLLADPQAGLTPALQNFFNSVQGVADDPASGPARQVLLGDAQALVTRFQTLQDRLENLGTNSDILLRDYVDQINSLGQAIADVNLDIANGIQNGGNVLPNDLLDQRDELVRELAEMIDVTTVEQEDGMLNVFIGSGQSLVLGQFNNDIIVTPGQFDPEELDVAIQQPGLAPVVITEQLTGGKLGGSLDFRDRVLKPAENALGRVAIGLTETFNAQHRLGVDLNGALGGDFFNIGTPNAFAHSDNTGAGTVSASIANAGNLTTSDYILESVDGGNLYSLTRLSDNQVFNIDTLGASPFNYQVDGFQLTINAGAAAGDLFEIQPTNFGAETISLAISDPARVAAATPIRTLASFGNLGDGEISQGSVSNVASLPLSLNGGDITLTFDPNALGAGIPGFNVTGGPGGTLAYDPATEGNGKEFTLGAPFDGITFEVSGAPTAGDTFTVTDNLSGISDNRNALALANLQTTNTLAGNNTYQSAYGELVADVGSQTRQAQITVDAQSVLLDQATAARESVSGVNLDEEAANLVRYQQAYQAAAQMISVANSLFDSILLATRN